jgi:hypothetical protein
LETPGEWYAARAWAGSLLSSTIKVSVVNNVPLGCVTDGLAICVSARWAGAPDWSKDMLAPVLIKAVVLKSSGLAQPGVVRTELTKDQ